jgi:hypothetical protein
VDALCEKELPGAGVVKLAPIVALESLHTCVELGGGVGDEGGEVAECVRFEA